MTTVGLNQHLYDLHKQIDVLAKQADLVSGQAEELLAERAEIAETLTAFYLAPLSLSSVQPLLDLAVRLNPSLKEERHQRAVKETVENAEMWNITYPSANFRGKP